MPPLRAHWFPASCPLPVSLPVIEFLFLADPPLMFWHAAGALGQPYWLLPVPQAYWMQEEMQVKQGMPGGRGGTGMLSGTPQPTGAVLLACLHAWLLTHYVARNGRGCFCLPALLLARHLTLDMPRLPQVPTGEVLDILSVVLRDPAAPASCLPGTFASIEDGAVRCIACSAGTYAYTPGAAACKLCPPGRMAPHLGSTACRTCQPGTYSSADGKACVACPAGEISAAVQLAARV